ncbi:flavin reductase [Azotobacter chroococcum]|uniref:flavin reductase n=1 Tax=Azotobacter chroococcum TaxID=353 RepID=UPI002FCD7FAC
MINVPTADLVDAVVCVDNSSGRSSNTFETCGLSAAPTSRVDAPLIEECYANFECRLADDRQIDEYGLFIWEFRVAGQVLDLSKRFRPQNL